jgi:hypothetical protein
MDRKVLSLFKAFLSFHPATFKNPKKECGLNFNTRTGDIRKRLGCLIPSVYRHKFLATQDSLE